MSNKFGGDISMSNLNETCPVLLEIKHADGQTGDENTDFQLLGDLMHHFKERVVKLHTLRFTDVAAMCEINIDKT
jgi:hypothetical protein